MSYHGDWATANKHERAKLNSIRPTTVWHVNICICTLWCLTVFVFCCILWIQFIYVAYNTCVMLVKRSCCYDKRYWHVPPYLCHTCRRCTQPRMCSCTRSFRRHMSIHSCMGYCHIHWLLTKERHKTTLSSIVGIYPLLKLNVWMVETIMKQMRTFSEVKGGVKRLNNHSPNIRTYNLQHLSP